MFWKAQHAAAFGLPLNEEVISLQVQWVIDMLKQLKAGDIDLAAALNGAAS